MKRKNNGGEISVSDYPVVDRIMAVNDSCASADNNGSLSKDTWVLEPSCPATKQPGRAPVHRELRLFLPLARSVRH